MLMTLVNRLRAGYYPEKRIKSAFMLNDVRSLAACLFSCFLLMPLHAVPPNGDIAPISLPDGEFNAGDLVVVQRHILGSETIPAHLVSNADVAPLNAPDGLLTIADYVVLQRALMGDILLAVPVITLPPYNPDGTTTLTWNAIQGAVEYLVEVQVDGGAWQGVYTTQSTSYDINPTLATGRYQYRVSACVSSCGIASVPQGFIHQDETEPGSRTSFALSYAYQYYDTEKTQLQTQTMFGARTDLPVGGEDDTVTQYDIAGNITSIANALGQTVTMANYNARGQAGLITDANGVQTILTYHPRGWLRTRTVKDPGGDPAKDALTDFQYDNVGQLTQITLPDGSFLKYEYDDARRLAAIENTLGERIEYTLDNAGNREKEEICSAGTGGDTGIACSVQKTQTRIFDGLSRLRRDIGSASAVPASKTTELDYDKNSNLEVITDGKDHPTEQRYDALDRLIKQIDPDDNNSDGNNPEVTYSYDSRDNIKTVVDQEGLITSYQYNVWDDLTQVDSPDTGVTDYRYDNAGNRVWMRDARGQVVIYKYDALNRLTHVIAVGSKEELVSYGYDDTSMEGGVVNYGVGRLTHISDESGRTDYRYDARGNLIKKAVRIDGLTFATVYTYTLADRVASITYPSGRIVSYVRDSDGRITDVNTQKDADGASTTVVSNISYKPFGPVNGYTFANGISRSLTFDTDYLLTDIEDTGGSNPMDWFYRYDANANIEGIDNQDDASKDQDFTYDEMDRLDTADGNYGNIDFDYDDVGNRLTKTRIHGGVTTTETYTYDYQDTPPDSHRLKDILIQETGQADATRNFSYTDNGNTEQDTRPDGSLLDLHYNALNRYTQLDIDTVPTAWYQHNALGQRVKKTTLTETVYYHYDEAGKILAESDAQGNVMSDYVFVDNMRVARYDNSAAYYFHNDHLGRPIALTDIGGSVAWQVDYLPFGQVYNVVNNTTKNTLGFPGQILDADSGFFYNYFRDYEPSIGRYIQSDPIGLSGGMNSFGYANQNPLTFFDTQGLVAGVDDLVVIGVGGAILAGTACYATNCGQAVVDYLAEAVDNLSDSIDDKRRKAKERRKYKDFCDNPPRPTGDKCTDLKNKINYQRQCADLKERWDKSWPNDKFPGGRHQSEIKERRASADKLQEQYDNECGKDC